MESWQRPPAAAGRVEKMISNPEKCRPDGGPGAREGEGETAAWTENGEKRLARVSQQALRTMNTRCPFLRSCFTSFIEGLLCAKAESQALGRHWWLPGAYPGSWEGTSENNQEDKGATGIRGHQGGLLNSPTRKVKPERGEAFHHTTQNGKEARTGNVAMWTAESMQPGVDI